MSTVKFKVDAPNGEDPASNEKSPLLGGDPTNLRLSFHRRASIKGTAQFFGKSIKVAKAAPLEPREALAPIVGGINGNEYSSVKSIPPFAPYTRLARHRSFRLWWINEFRHWWKSARLLVRLAGLFCFALIDINWYKMCHLNLYKAKGITKGYKLVKKLGQGGVTRPFLKGVKIFTRALRILVGSWRYVESAQCRRLEVGVEEFNAFFGNRISRWLARIAVDYFSYYLFFPFFAMLLQNSYIPDSWWHPAAALVILGTLRACAPYAASFQGSRVGRILTRATFNWADDRWLPTQRINDLNLTCATCCERDEVDDNSDLFKLAHFVAAALGKERDEVSNVHGSCDPALAEGGEGSFESSLENIHRETVQALEERGFHLMGCGSGGYTTYVYRRTHSPILLHVTPYGPSILDDMPRYIILEREDSQDTRVAWSTTYAQFWTGPPVLEGYCYSGAFFSSHHWAELKERYDEELFAYENACRVMCHHPGDSSLPKPPTDLPSLKAFLNSGRRQRDQAKYASRSRQIQKEVAKVAKQMITMMKSKSGDCAAPKGVILYFEGLDCAGKSSTGGLIQQVLVDAGYHVEMRQYNRPPTPEQKAHEWMWRFDKPDLTPKPKNDNDDGDGGTSEGYRHSALVWDRGPAGDFIYGALKHADEDERRDRHREFMAFDDKCRSEGIILFKLLFVTDRDAIARTLGKRLAQKKVSRDLRTWLDASAGQHGWREGLDEIELHIDPTDFVAFNAYHNNLRGFVDFAKNTDVPLNPKADSAWINPWLVVSTSKRHPARLQLLSYFSRLLKKYPKNPRGGVDSLKAALNAANNTRTMA